MEVSRERNKNGIEVGGVVIKQNKIGIGIKNRIESHSMSKRNPIKFKQQ
jgi:hypothetical protein